MFAAFNCALGAIIQSVSLISVQPQHFKYGICHFSDRTYCKTDKCLKKYLLPSYLNYASGAGNQDKAMLCYKNNTCTSTATFKQR